MNTDVVSRAKAALEGVTDGPWKSCHVGNIHYGVSHGDYTFPTVVKAQVQYDGFGNGSRKDDAEFIAAARSLVPELVAEVEKWRAAAVFAADDNGALQAMTAERDHWKDEVQNLRFRLEISNSGSLLLSQREDAHVAEVEKLHGTVETIRELATDIEDRSLSPYRALRDILAVIEQLET